MLPDKLIGQLVATQPQYQPYHPFQLTSFHSTFPQSYQQPAPYLMSTALVAAEKVESGDLKVSALNDKHKSIWNSLIQMDPNPSMVQYHKSFKKGYLDLLVFHQKHNSVRVTTSYNSTLNSWIRNQITNIKKYKEKNNDSPFWKYHEDWYIAFLNKVGLDCPPKVNMKKINTWNSLCLCGAIVKYLT
jgi:hypothetical protein